jgi:hypothetical protein
VAVAALASVVQVFSPHDASSTVAIEDLQQDLHKIELPWISNCGLKKKENKEMRDALLGVSEGDITESAQD